MTRRYYVPDLTTGLVAMPTEEAQHAIRVMRVQVGDGVTLFDGQGRQCEAQVVAIGRNECQCDAAAIELVDREPACEIHLGIALPKPDRAKELIERLTELGVARVTPVTAARTQRPTSDSVLEKLRRGVVEACKQSGRNRLMTIDDSVSSSEFFSAHSGASVCIIAHPMDVATSIVDLRGNPTVTAAIGPEGGWTDDEVATAIAAGFQGVNLGDRIYRIETAAVAIASVLVA